MRTWTGTWPTSTPRLAERLTTGARRLVAFLSDFGTADEFVGVVHAVLHRHAPDARVVDLTHHVAPHDVRAGALALRRAAPYVTPAVILAVIDPGVGTSRRAVAIRTGDGPGGSDPRGAVMVGPDNGLLLPAAEVLGGVTASVELPGATDAPGATFAGRDVFAPAAGRAAAGVPIQDLGTPLDPSVLVSLDLPEALPEPSDPRWLRAEVVWVDRFGNAQLNSAEPAVSAIRLAQGDSPLPVSVVASYGDIGAPGYALVVDSYGMLSLCADRRPAATELGLRAGQQVWLCREERERR